MAEALLLHEVGEHARVRGQAGDGDADVGVDGEEFLLVRGEFFGISLRVDVNVSFMVVLIGVGGVRRRSGGAGSTLMAQSTACVLLAIPTTTEPCLTASAAYSTWKIRPCGELRG